MIEEEVDESDDIFSDSQEKVEPMDIDRGSGGKKGANIKMTVIYFKRTNLLRICKNNLNNLK